MGFKYYITTLILVLSLISLGSAFNWDNGTRAHFNMNDLSGSPLDSFSNYITLSQNLTAYGVTGKIGTAINYTATSNVNGSLTYNASNLSITNYPFSFNAWIRANQTQRAEAGIISLGNSSGSSTKYILLLAAENIRLFARNGSSVSSTISGANGNNGSWIMVTGVFANRTGRELWVNGKNVGNSTTDVLFDGVDQFAIGADAAAGAPVPTIQWPFSGLIDEVGVWNKSLTAADIAALYNGGQGLGFGSLNLNSPSDNDVILINTPTEFNASWSILPANASNLSLYTNYTGSLTLNKTINVSGITNTSVITQTFTDETSVSALIQVCMIDGNCLNTSAITLFIKPLKETSQTFNATTFTSNIENFKINLTYDSSNYPGISAILVYNGTSYLGSQTLVGANTTFSRDVNIPQGINQNVNFYWVIALTKSNGTTYYYNSSTNTQNIYMTSPIVVSTTCGAGYSQAIYFTFADEVNLTAMNVTASYNFAYGFSNTSAIQTFGNFTLTDGFYLCVNSTTPNYTLSYGEIQYTYTGYTERRYYLFENTRLTNSQINLTLYSLLSSLQQSFKLEVEGTNLNPYINKYTTLLRWYPNLNEYRVVDMGKTDETGATIIHVKAEDVDYRIGVYERNGTLIKLASPIRMVCLLSPCTYTLKISPIEQDFIGFYNLEYSLTYNETTKVFTLVFNDPSQATQEFNLTIYRNRGDSVLPVCSNVVASYTGVISCDISSFATGEFKAVVYRTASPKTPITQKIITMGTSPFKSQWGLWLTLLVGVPIIFVFAYISPFFALVGGVIALLPAYYFGAVNWAILGGIAVMAAIVAHFLKRI